MQKYTDERWVLEAATYRSLVASILPLHPCSGHLLPHHHTPLHVCLHISIRVFFVQRSVSCLMGLLTLTVKLGCDPDRRSNHTATPTWSVPRGATAVCMCVCVCVCMRARAGCAKRSRTKSSDVMPRVQRAERFCRTCVCVVHGAGKRRAARGQYV